jgi:hypothetical protein
MAEGVDIGQWQERNHFFLAHLEWLLIFTEKDLATLKVLICEH